MDGAAEFDRGADGGWGRVAAAASGGRQMRGRVPTRRRVLRSTLGAALPILGAACGTAAEPSPSASLTPGKLVIWGATNDGGHWEGDAAAPFRREFEEKNAGVTIEALRVVAGGTTGFASP